MADAKPNTEDLVVRIVSRIVEAREFGQVLSVEEACGDAVELREPVAQCLARYDHLEDFLLQPGSSAHGPGARPFPIEPFEVIGPPLGEGGMGIVYRVRNRLEDRAVALKIMRPEIARTDPNARARFLREARSLSRIRHPHVVEIYHVGESGGIPYLTMPLLEGRNLEEDLKATPRPALSEVLRLGGEIASGLAAAHAAGLVHRDVKPSNIWLEGSRRSVKLLDFGLARPIDDSDRVTEVGRAPGTPPYMSPEQLTGSTIDHRSDLFSLGTVLYRLATGINPFAAATLSRIHDLVVRHDPPAAHQVDPMIPADLGRLITDLHAKDPAARPQSAEEVERRLAAIQAGTNTPASDTVPLHEDTPTRRRVLRGGAILTSGLLLGGAALYAFWPRGPVPVPAPVRQAAPESDLDVTVWKAGHHREKGKHLWDPGMLPLRGGDAVRLEARLNRPAFVYIVWLQADGTLTPGPPWRENDWKERPATENPVTFLNVPEQPDEGFCLDNKVTGIETFLLLVRDDPLPRDGNLRACLTAWQPANEGMTDLEVAVWLLDGKPDTRQLRGSFDNKVRINNPIGVVRSLMQTLTRELALTTRAVCFGYRGT